MRQEIFRGAWLKIGRAFHLLEELKTDCDTWALAAQVEIKQYVEESGWNTWTIGPIPSPPEDWGVRAGEVAFHLRSALDQAVYALVTNNGGVPSTSTQFPICVTDQQWRSQGGRYLQGMAPKPVDVITEAQPLFQSPAMPKTNILSALNELCVVDKHRLLLPTASALAVHDIQVLTACDAHPTHELKMGVRDEKIVSRNQEEWIVKARATAPGMPDVNDETMELSLADGGLVRLDVNFTTYAPYEVRTNVDGLSTMARYVEGLLLDLEGTL